MKSLSVVFWETHNPLNTILLQSRVQGSSTKIYSRVSHTANCLLPDSQCSWSTFKFQNETFLSIESKKSLLQSGKTSFPSPSNKITSNKQPQILSKMRGGDSGSFGLTILMPLCSLAVHTARSFSKLLCETGGRCLALICVAHTMHFISALCH